jgi:cGMP-dependent protein kinase
MIYEFLFGYLPFGDEEEEPYAIYEKILDHELNFPSWVENRAPCKMLIEQLLNRNPSIRTGGSVDTLKGHTWFLGLNWEKQALKQLKPPFIPKINDFSEEIEESIIQSRDLENFIRKTEDCEKLVSVNYRSDSVEDWDYEF